MDAVKNEKNMKKPKPDFKSIGRIMSYIMKKYKGRFCIAIISTILSSFAGVYGIMFLQSLIDDHITPLVNAVIGGAAADYTGLFLAIMKIAAIYVVGIISNFLCTYLMVVISQGVLKTVRDDMFSHMQTLPIKYFDTNAFGDIMSRYTNDTDTLEQMIAQSIPQIINTVVTVVIVFIAMLKTSIPLTLFMFITIGLMMVITKILGGKSAKYFMSQQRAFGKLDGFIEEMVNGQKVIKVFNHESKSKEEFDALNGELRDNAKNAHKFSNILMPIMGNLGNLQYVLLAIVGGVLAINGVGSLTIGGIVSFLELSRSFTRPITQVSQQINSVVMALAGASRIFNMMDEPSETDEGYVTLVNAKYDENGNITAYGIDTIAIE
ncbi:MAG: ABC transporter ATP-binding protein, partial [Eubacteriales bacterium]